MRIVTPFALGAACLGLRMAGNHQVDGFVVVTAGSAGRVLHRGRTSFAHAADRSGSISSSSLRGFLPHHRRASFSRPRSTTCRFMNAGFGKGGDSAAARKTTKKGKGKKSGGTAEQRTGEDAEKKGTGQRQLFMQFTCNLCEGVSQYMINKNAYEDGIVICTCQSCGARHLIADNLKKLDFPAFGNNIEEYMQSTGTPEEVKKGRAPDLTPEIIEKFDVAMGKDGVLTLSPKDGVDEGTSSSS